MAESLRRGHREPDETRKFDKGKVDIVNLSGGTVGRFLFEPGWKWSEDVKPIAGTGWCQASHHAYQRTGRLHVVMSDGSEFEVGPGEVCIIPPGHDAWVVGNEPVTGVDWAGMANYAKK
ncbi:MAG: cupin domain-containing protein [Dehalococcoidia bacterium]